MVVEITLSAKKYIDEVLEMNNANGIRVYFAGMGWGGPKLGLALDEPENSDVIEEINGIRVAFDQRIKDQTTALKLDFEDSQHGSGLIMVGQDECC
jgi:HesB-like selenoprotein